VWTGYVHKDRKTALFTVSTVFTSCSKAFLILIKDKLEEAGIHGGSLWMSKNNYHRLSYSIYSSLKLYDFMYNHRVDVSNGLLLERKKKVFEKSMNIRYAAVAVLVRMHQ
jgi:hypothetical protein